MSANSHEDNQKPHSTPANAPTSRLPSLWVTLGRQTAKTLLQKLWEAFLGTPESPESDQTLWDWVLNALRILTESGFGLW